MYISFLQFTYSTLDHKVVVPSWWTDNLMRSLKQRDTNSWRKVTSLTLKWLLKREMRWCLKCFKKCKLYWGQRHYGHHWGGNITLFLSEIPRPVHKLAAQNGMLRVPMKISVSERLRLRGSEQLAGDILVNSKHKSKPEFEFFKMLLGSLPESHIDKLSMQSFRVTKFKLSDQVSFS